MTNPDICEDGDSIFGTFSPVEGDSEHQGLLELNMLDKKEAKKFIGAKSADEIIFDIKKTLKSDSLISQVLGIDIKEADSIAGDYKLVVKNINRKVKGRNQSGIFRQAFW